LVMLDQHTLLRLPHTSSIDKTAPGGIRPQSNF